MKVTIRSVWQPNTKRHWLEVVKNGEVIVTSARRVSEIAVAVVEYDGHIWTGSSPRISGSVIHGPFEKK